MAKQIRYSEDFKKRAVSMYLLGELSCNQISQNIHVHPNTLSAWIKQFKNSPEISTLQPPKNEYIGKQPFTNQQIDAIFSTLSQIETQIEMMKRLIVDY